MVSKQWLLATSFVARKHTNTRLRDRNVVSLETYRIVRTTTFDDSRINLSWPTIIDTILSKVEE